MSCRRLSWGLVFILSALGAGAGGRLNAQEPTPTAEFDFDGVDLRVVIGALAETAGLNIVFGQLPNVPVTLRTSRPVSVDEVRSLLQSLASANGLELIAEDGFIRIVAVAPPEPVTGGRPAAGRAPAQTTEVRRLYVYQPRHARAQVVIQTLRGLFHLGGTFDAPAGNDELSLSQALREQQVAPVQPEAAPPPPPVAPGAAQDQGLAVGLQQPVDVVEDPTSNAILILATPTDYAVLEAALQALDTRPLQVLIEVLVAEVRHNRNTALGIDVNIPLKEGDEDGVTFSLQGLSAGDVAMQVLGIGAVNAEVVVRALASVGDVSILSRPILLAQNNSEARILVGDQRPFIQVFRALPTDNAVRDQVVQYRNVGTQLAIKPTISNDGYVNLAVAQEVSTATAETQFGAPVINTREAETDLIVRDGQTIVLGGLIDSQREETNSGVPLLKDIPLIGLLFRSTQYRVVKSELLLMLTTHVIRSDDELDRTIDQLRNRMEDLDEMLPDSLAVIPGPGVDAPAVRLDTIPVPPDTTALSSPPATRRSR